MVWRNAGGICERKTLFWMKKKRIKPDLRACERDLTLFPGPQNIRVLTGFNKNNTIRDKLKIRVLIGVLSRLKPEVMT